MNGAPDLMSLLNDPGDTKQKINNFAQNNLQGVDPEAKVRELVNSGQMSQSQYNMLSKMASFLMKQL